MYNSSGFIAPRRGASHIHKLSALLGGTGVLLGGLVPYDYGQLFRHSEKLLARE